MNRKNSLYQIFSDFAHIFERLSEQKKYLLKKNKQNLFVLGPLLYYHEKYKMVKFTPVYGKICDFSFFFFVFWSH